MQPPWDIALWLGAFTEKNKVFIVGPTLNVSNKNCILGSFSFPKMVQIKMVTKYAG
jgi:hypothetical protein